MAEIDGDLAIDADLVAVGAEDVARFDNDLAPTLALLDARAAHDAPPVQHTVVSARLLAKVVLILSEILGRDELPRKESRSLESSLGAAAGCRLYGSHRDSPSKAM